jgi:hypothetical protein
MRKFIHKVQELGKKAVEIQQALHSAPAKAAELREAVVMSAAELQQIRADVQANLHGLRVNSEERLLVSMREINDASLVFEEAGYELTGLDLDLSLPQKLLVHLAKFEDIPHSTLHSLVANESRITIKSILSGILKAEETAANVELTYLNLTGLVVHVGAVPLIRMCWRTEAAEEPAASPATAVQAAPQLAAAPAPASVAPSSPAFGSFFEQRTIPTTKISSSQPEPVAPVPTLTSSNEPASQPASAPAESPWSRSALDRFKKMPDLSKHRR